MVFQCLCYGISMILLWSFTASAMVFQCSNAFAMVFQCLCYGISMLVLSYFNDFAVVFQCFCCGIFAVVLLITIDIVPRNNHNHQLTYISTCIYDDHSTRMCYDHSAYMLLRFCSELGIETNSKHGQEAV